MPRPSFTHDTQTPAAIAYTLDLNYMFQREAADALVKNRAFQTAQITEQNNVLNPGMGGADFIVWHHRRQGEEVHCPHRVPLRREAASAAVT
ncbi:MAG TPA: hypothetical protein VJR47_20490 [Stellaceae bacterium]|nr:hypothetical protein [Stellaceae bacterium]